MISNIRLKFLFLSFFIVCFLCGCPSTESKASTSKITSKIESIKQIEPVSISKQVAADDKKIEFKYISKLECSDMSRVLEGFNKNPLTTNVSEMIYLDQLTISFKDSKIIIQRTCYQLK